MGMHGILITLSSKRLAQLEEEPDMLEDVLEARRETDIPGLLDLGKAWDALDVLLSERGKDAVLGDAVLARTGETLDFDGDFGKPRVLSPARVAEVAKRLAQLPGSVVRDRYATLAGFEVHGGFGKTPDADEMAVMQKLAQRVVALYQDAAKAKHSMLSIVV